MSNKVKEIPSGGALPNSINVGHGNFVFSSRIVAILEWGSLPMKRLRERASEKGCLIDATAGRKTRCLVVTDSNHVILSALAAQTLHDRVQEKTTAVPARIEWEDGEFVS